MDGLGRSGLDLDKTFQQLLTNLMLAKSQISSCLEVPWILLLKFSELKPKETAGLSCFLLEQLVQQAAGSRQGVPQDLPLAAGKKTNPRSRMGACEPVWSSELAGVQGEDLLYFLVEIGTSLEENFGHLHRNS